MFGTLLVADWLSHQVVGVKSAFCKIKNGLVRCSNVNSVNI